MGVVMRYGAGGTNKGRAEGGSSGGGVTMTKLWTNLDPSSNFDAQTVQGVFAGFDYYIVEFVMTANGTHAISICRSGDDYSISAGGQSSYWYSRRITITDTDATFSLGYRNGTYGQSFAIPLFIWGIKL